MNNRPARSNKMAWVLIGLLSLSLGCRATIGAARLIIRPAVRMHPGAVMSGAGEQRHIEGYEPSGDSVFVFIRIEPKERQDPAAVTLREFQRRLIKK